MSLQLTWGASSLLEVDVSEMQHAGHHPEQVQLLRVVQADLLHGYAHAVEVALVVQQRVLQRARLHVLRNQDRAETVTDCWFLLSSEVFQTSSSSSGSYSSFFISFQPILSFKLTVNFTFIFSFFNFYQPTFLPSLILTPLPLNSLSKLFSLSPFQLFTRLSTLLLSSFALAFRSIRNIQR